MLVHAHASDSMGTRTELLLSALFYRKIFLLSFFKAKPTCFTPVAGDSVTSTASRVTICGEEEEQEGSWVQHDSVARVVQSTGV